MINRSFVYPIQQRRCRIVDHQTLIALGKDRLERHPMGVDQICLIVELNDTTGNDQHKALRTFVSVRARGVIFGGDLGAA
ncbi:hypothetical protein, partial [Novosphingobium sp.]|uniref:hypothetical protein n=1 Tax=Novosphingobium sp. TaxID=1874826 RepID=UPI002B9FCFA2